MIRSGIRGGHRVCQWSQRLGLLNQVARYELPGGIVFTVPIWIQDNRWDAADVRDYSTAEVSALCKALRNLDDVTLFDCGADIGILSAKICAASANIARIYAFEPNRSVFDILTTNLAALPAESYAFCGAVGNVESSGALTTPDYDRSAHARFVTPGQGDTPIICIDSLGCRDPNVAFKIDVEGGELEVLQGARETIAQADRVVISFEAHPLVARRTGRHPRVCTRFLQQIRPFRFIIAETGAELSPDWPPPGWNSVNNILCQSQP